MSGLVDDIEPGWGLKTPTFAPKDFDKSVQKHGVMLVHWRALRCPVGMVDLYDGRSPQPHDHIGCSNGFLHVKVGCVRALFTSNSERYKNSDRGLADGSEVFATLDRFYDGTDDQEVVVAPFDRFYLAEEALPVPFWQLFEHHISGKDRLQFPPVEVSDLIDAAGVSYRQGVDFDLSGDSVVWRMGGRRPAYDLDREKGAICSVRYLYRPYYYVASMPHQIRVAQTVGEDGQRRVTRMHQAVSLSREYTFQSVTSNVQPTDAATARRLAPFPSVGSFASR